MTELEKKEHKDEKEKVLSIIVNATSHDVEKGEMTYDEIVTLAFPDYPQHPERTYSVTYERGHGNKPEGIYLLVAVLI